MQWFTRDDTSSTLLDVLDIADGEPIRAMEISQKYKSLYVAADTTIKQINLVMCARRYDNCMRCVRDPYCGWDQESNSCKPYYPGYILKRNIL